MWLTILDCSPLFNAVFFEKLHPMFEKHRLQDEEIYRNMVNEIKFQEVNRNSKKKASRAGGEELDFSKFEILTKVKYQEK